MSTHCSQPRPCTRPTSQVQKYEFLTTKPRFGEGKQISLRTLPKTAACLAKCLADRKPVSLAGDGSPPDGSDKMAQGPGADLGDPKKKGTTQGLHELAAAIVSHGDLELAKGLFRHQFCCTDALPDLASRGLLVEVSFVRELLQHLASVGERGDFEHGTL